MRTADPIGTRCASTKSLNLGFIFKTKEQKPLIDRSSAATSNHINNPAANGGECQGFAPALLRDISITPPPAAVTPIHRNLTMKNDQ
jgi:hypothetical protein